MQAYSAYFVLFFSWVIYFFLHSFLATEEVKNYLESNWNVNRRSQRIIYSVISSAGLLVLLVLNGAIKSDNVIAVTKELKIVSMFLAGSGVLIVRAGFKYYSIKVFLGLEKESKNPLVTKGILSKVRHPIYSGTILITLGFLLFDPRLSTFISCVAIFIYLFIGIRLEENKLIREYGNIYLNYRTKVPMLIPKFNLFGKS